MALRLVWARLQDTGRSKIMAKDLQRKFKETSTGYCHGLPQASKLHSHFFFMPIGCCLCCMTVDCSRVQVSRASPHCSISMKGRVCCTYLMWKQASEMQKQKSLNYDSSSELVVVAELMSPHHQEHHARELKSKQILQPIP